MSITTQLLTSKQQWITIQSDNPKIVNHFNNSDIENHANTIIDQINNDRMYDFIFNNRNDLIVLDIGANVGLFTLFAQDSAKDIYSVEPTPLHFEILQELTKNYHNVHTINSALHNENTMIDFYLSDINSTMNSSFNKFGNKTTVKAQTIFKIMEDNNISHIDIVKCDIEGSEMIALTDETVGAVADRIDSWFVEVHSTGNGIDVNREKIKTIFVTAVIKSIMSITMDFMLLNNQGH